MSFQNGVKFVVAGIFLSLLSACAWTPVAPPRGIMYTNQSAPLFNASETGVAKGEATAYNVMFLVGWGDCSIKTAAANGGITKIKNIDYELMNVFIFFQQFKVTVYGDQGEAKAPQTKAQ
jgi:hypothetical protein